MACAKPATNRACDGRIAKNEKSANPVRGSASGKRARNAARQSRSPSEPFCISLASPWTVTRASACASTPPPSACITRSDTRGAASMSKVCPASRLTCTTNALPSARTA